MKRDTLIRLLFLDALVCGIVACLCSCVATWKLNQQTKPEFYVPRSEHYPTGKTMGEWIAELQAKDAKAAKEKTEFEKLK